MTDFEQEIAKHEAEIARLKRERAAFEAQTPDQQLAVNLHSALCSWNHTDGCGWFYEVHKNVDDWHGSAHERWIDNAKKVRGLLPGLDDKTIVSVTKAIKSIG